MSLSTLFKIREYNFPIVLTMEKIIDTCDNIVTHLKIRNNKIIFKCMLLLYFIDKINEMK
jgi:hypothetical protein